MTRKVDHFYSKDDKEADERALLIKTKEEAKEAAKVCDVIVAG